MTTRAYVKLRQGRRPRRQHVRARTCGPVRRLKTVSTGDRQRGRLRCAGGPRRWPCSRTEDAACIKTRAIDSSVSLKGKYIFASCTPSRGFQLFSAEAFHKFDPRSLPPSESLSNRISAPLPPSPLRYVPGPCRSLSARLPPCLARALVLRPLLPCSAREPRSPQSRSFPELTSLLVSRSAPEPVGRTD